MATTLYYGSGSPYAWRVWLALEHKQIPYEFKLMSFDAGDLKKPEFLALNPRGKIPVLVDDGFAIAESAAIVEYIADRWPGGATLFAADLRQRAVERRMVREVDDYVQPIVSRGGKAILFTPPEKRSAETIAAIRSDLETELVRWESAMQGDYLSTSLSAADFTLYPMIALFQRMDMRHPEFNAAALFGPRLTAWAERMAALPATQKTWPPHWKA